MDEFELFNEALEGGVPFIVVEAENRYGVVDRVLIVVQGDHAQEAADLIRDLEERTA